MSKSDIMTHLISFSKSAVAKNINCKDADKGKIRVVSNTKVIKKSI